MKRFVLFVAPVLIAVLVFFGIIFFLDKKTGKGALQITSIPKSNVYLDNILIGTTPFCACDSAQMLAIGEHSVKLVPSEGDFVPFEEKITINKSTLTAVDRTFSGNGSEGSITSLIPLNDKNEVEIMVTSLPDKANVFLDNNPVGETPLLLKQVSQSDHDLKVTKDGYKDKSLKIKTASGYELSSMFYLGVNTDLSVPQAASSGASPVVTPSSSSVLILNTPTGFLRVRKEGAIDSAEIGRVKPGETYELIEEKDNWFEIKFASASGWISSQYAAKN